MRFRKARTEDIPQMLEIIKLNNPNYPKKLALKELKEMFSESLSKPTYIVAEEKGNIVAFNGYIRSWVDNLVVNLFWLNTHPKYIKQGIGSRLVNNLVRRIRDPKETPKAKLVTISTKIPSFFMRLGFKTIAKKYDRDYDLMALKI